MKVWQILQSLESLEETMGHCYDTLALRFADDPGAAALFSGLRDEKLSQRDAVRRERLAMFRSLENYTDVAGYDRSALELALRAVEDGIARVPRQSLGDSLRSAVAIVREAERRRAGLLSGRSGASLETLVEALGRCDQEQAVKIGGFARGRGIELDVSRGAPATRPGAGPLTPG